MLNQTDYARAVDYAVSGTHLADSSHHGEDHWQCVAGQGIWLSRSLGLGREGRLVGLLFGLFHDCRRENDHHDPDHGARAAEAFLSAPSLAGLPETFRARMENALIHHDQGHVSDDLLTGLGWDSDRSLLGRCDIKPDIAYFSCIQPDAFAAFLSHGETLMRTPPNWDALWAAAL